MIIKEFPNYIFILILIIVFCYIIKLKIIKSKEKYHVWRKFHKTCILNDFKNIYRCYVNLATRYDYKKKSEEICKKPSIYYKYKNSNDDSSNLHYYGLDNTDNNCSNTKCTKGIFTLQDCRRYCNLNASCTGFGWNIPDNYCFLKKKSLTNVSSTINVDLYTKQIIKSKNYDSMIENSIIYEPHTTHDNKYYCGYSDNNYKWLNNYKYNINRLSKNKCPILYDTLKDNNNETICSKIKDCPPFYEIYHSPTSEQQQPPNASNCELDSCSIKNQICTGNTKGAWMKTYKCCNGINGSGKWVHVYDVTSPCPNDIDNDDYFDKKCIKKKNPIFTV